MKYNLLIIGLIPLFSIALVSNASVHIAPKLITAPNDIIYEVNSTGNQLIWEFEAHESNDEPSKYTVTIDDIELEGHILAEWKDNEDIIVNVDGLDIGDHIVKITVNDTGTDAGQASSTVDSASVTVTTAGEENTNSDVTTITTTNAQGSTVTKIEVTSNPVPFYILPLFISLILIAKFKNWK